jgi:hypothetical protein
MFLLVEAVPERGDLILPEPRGKIRHRGKPDADFRSIGALMVCVLPKEFIHDRLGNPHLSAQRTLPLKGRADLDFIASSAGRCGRAKRSGNETRHLSAAARLYADGLVPAHTRQGTATPPARSATKFVPSNERNLLRPDEYLHGVGETVRELKGFYSQFRYEVPSSFAFHWLTDFEEGKGLYRLMSQTGPLRVRVHEDARLVERLGWKPVSRFTVRLTGPLTWTRTIELFDVHGRLQGHSLVEEELQESETGTFHRLTTSVTARTSVFRVVYVLGGRRSMIQSLDEQYRDIKKRMESDFRRSRAST